MAGLIPQTRKIHRYLEGLFAREDDELRQARLRSQKAGLPNIEVPPLVGKTLWLLARMVGASRILEVGTLGGYSTLWLARALPQGGQLTTIELEPAHAAVAQQNFNVSSQGSLIKLVVGNGHQLLPQMVSEGTAPFDFIFLDAEKAGYPAYLDWLIQLSHQGSLIVADNCIRSGKVIEPSESDEPSRALAKFNQLIANHPKLESVVLPSFGGIEGGSLDGLALCRIR